MPMAQLRGQEITTGVVVTNRDRTGPMDTCLASLAAQQTPPAWVVIADLGSVSKFISVKAS